MKNPTEPDKQERLRQLRNRVVAILGFIESRHDFPHVEQLRKVVEDAFERGDLPTLRLVSRDMEKAVMGLAPHERDGLEAILSELGYDRESDIAALRQKVNRAITRGNIASEKERRRLEEYLELLETGGGDQREIERISELLRST